MLKPMGVRTTPVAIGMSGAARSGHEFGFTRVSILYKRPVLPDKLGL